MLLAGLTLVAALSTALSLGALALALRGLESVWRDRVEAVTFLHQVTSPLDRAVPAIVGHGSASRTPADSSTAVIQLRMARRAADSAWHRYLVTTLTAEESALVREVTPSVQKALLSADSMASAMESRKPEAIAVTLDAVLLPALAEADRGLDALVALQSKITRSQVEAARERHRLAQLLLIASGIVTAALIIATLGSSGGVAKRTRWRR